MTDPIPQYLYVKSEEALAWVETLLIAHTLPPSSAKIIAQSLVSADLRGVDTHGTNRLPSYLARIRQNVLSPTALPTLQKITPVVAQVDGHNAFGFLAAHMGMAAAIEMAGEFGIGMVSVKGSNHFGMSAWVVKQALDEGMMSLVFTNSSPALPVCRLRISHQRFPHRVGSRIEFVILRGNRYPQFSFL